MMCEIITKVTALFSVGIFLPFLRINHHTKENYDDYSYNKGASAVALCLEEVI